MSGIVGMVNLDGAPVDRALLEEMTECLAFRGPDAQNNWIKGNAGFGHTLLRTTWESEHEHQPFSLDGRVWITADARIDDRASLIEKLKGKGQRVCCPAPDVEIILRAYYAWGEQCLEHLLGDFAFAIWDEPIGRLFCARDQFGVRPLYYFRSDKTFAFSNTLNCIRRHPEVSGDLNDLAVVDYLLVETNQDPATTTFSDINRIPPAHSLSISKDNCALRRYWSMPVDEPVFYKRNSDYVDRFKELLTIAVRDRVRTSPIAILMSGGLDSTTLAAAACPLLDQPSDLAAFTYVDDLGPVRERYYSGLVAGRLGIGIHYIGDDSMIEEDWHRRLLRTPELASPLRRERELAEWRMVAEHGRVAFYGEGPDHALWYEWQPYLRYLGQNRQWSRIVRDLFQHAIAHRRIIPITAILDYGRRFASHNNDSEFPPWLDDDFAAKTHARGRLAAWAAMHSGSDSPHPSHPMGYKSFSSTLWQRRFEFLDPGYTDAPLEFRYPYLDLRLLRYMLSVPVLPWCRRKYLLRQAMRGRLPAEVLSRNKEGISESAAIRTIRQSGMPPLVPTEELFKYINLKKLPDDVPDEAGDIWMNLRPVVLNHWLWCYTTAV